MKYQPNSSEAHHLLQQQSKQLTMQLKQSKLAQKPHQNIDRIMDIQIPEVNEKYPPYSTGSHSADSATAIQFGFTDSTDSSGYEVINCSSGRTDVNKDRESSQSQLINDSLNQQMVKEEFATCDVNLLIDISKSAAIEKPPCWNHHATNYGP